MICASGTGIGRVQIRMCQDASKYILLRKEAFGGFLMFKNDLANLKVTSIAPTLLVKWGL